VSKNIPRIVFNFNVQKSGKHEDKTHNIKSHVQLCKTAVFVLGVSEVLQINKCVVQHASLNEWINEWSDLPIR
jgi:hypothetical protein